MAWRKESNLKIGSAGELGIFGDAIAGQAFFDLAINALAGEISGHADGVLESICIRRSMADDGRALYPEERSAAVFRVVKPLLEIHKGAAGEQHAELAGDRGVQRGLQKSSAQRCPQNHRIR